MVTLQDVKLLLGIESLDRDDLLKLLIKTAETQLMGRLASAGVDAIPDELHYIAVELTVARYNRIGSEGMESESVEGHSAKYLTDDFAPYEKAISTYLTRNTVPKVGVVRFI